jgi:hypothetical protein
MAKSWGARIVGRLFGSRSDKKANAEGVETTNLEDPVKDGLLRLDAEPDKVPSVKDRDQFSTEIRPEVRDGSAPSKETSTAQLNVGKSDTREMPILSVEPVKENADELATPVSNCAPMQKPSPARVPKSQSGRLADKASGVGEGAAVDQSGESPSLVSNGRRKQEPNHGTQRKVTNKVPTKGRAKASIKVPASIKPEIRAPELVIAKDTVADLQPSSDWDLMKVGQGSEKSSELPKSTTTALKRSRKPKPNAMDQQVTDKELDELEAENARLKLLLHEKLRTNNDSIDYK